MFVKKIVGVVLSGFLASSGLAYAGVPVPNPVEETVTLVTASQDEGVETEEVETEEVEGSESEEASEDPPEQAQEGRARGAENRERAKAFTDAKKAWTDCVSQKAPEHEASGAEAPFDPEVACGEKPHPHDFGIGRSEDGERGRPDGVGPPADRPERSEDDAEAEDSTVDEDDDGGPPPHARRGPPEWAGQGRG